MQPFFCLRNIVADVSSTHRMFSRIKHCAWGAGLLFSGAVALSFGCNGDEDLPQYVPPNAKPVTPTSTTQTLDTSTVAELPGNEIEVEVPIDGTGYVDLAALTSTGASADEAVPIEWDISFHGFDLFTNSGASGAGEGGGFGPNPELDFLFDEVPAVPFLREDVTGGAFLDWYYYDGSVHQLWSLNDVYGVRTGERLYKIQLLSYYGEQLGAPVSALYQLRYAEVFENKSGETQNITGLDGTAGYPKISDSKPSGCLQLANGKVTLLAPDEARASSDWDLCFRRDSISVNGEMGGPGQATAAFVSRLLAEPSLDALKALTPEQVLRGFDDVDYATLSAPAIEYRGDRIISIFSGRWLERDDTGAVSPAAASWLVRSRDGEHFYSILVRDAVADASGIRRLKLRVHALDNAQP